MSEADPETPGQPHPWDTHLALEGAISFGAFVAYRNLGPSRTLEEVALRSRKSSHLMRRWSKDYAWKDRTRAYDAHLAAVKSAAADRAIAEAAARVAKLWEVGRIRTLERAYRSATRLQSVALQMLSLPVVKKVVRDGKETLEPAGRWSVRDAAALLRASAEIAYGTLTAGPRDGSRAVK